MLKLTGKTVSIAKSCDLSPKQLMTYSKLDESTRKTYVLSLMGLHRDRIRGVRSGARRTDFQDQLDKGPNSVLNRFQGLLDNGSDVMHRPFTLSKTSFWVGVEIECIVPGDDDSSGDCDDCDGSGRNTCYNCDGRGYVNLEDDNGNDYRVDCRSCDGDGHTDCDSCDGTSNGGSSVHEAIRRKLRLAKITNCSVKRDGSLSGEGVGVEVTVLFDAQYGFDKVAKVCKVLNDAGAIINDSCGLHVHLDQRGNDRRESLAMGSRLGKYLPILAQLVPSSRRNNTFCKLAVSRLDGCRYHAINMTSLSKHSTIEVRLHSGTTNAGKIESWVRLLMAIARSSTKSTAQVSTVEGLVRSLKLKGDLVAFVQKRFAKFNPNVRGAAPVEDGETEGVEDSTLNEEAV